MRTKSAGDAVSSVYFRQENIAVPPRHGAQMDRNKSKQALNEYGQAGTEAIQLW